MTWWTTQVSWLSRIVLFVLLNLLLIWTLGNLLVIAGPLTKLFNHPITSIVWPSQWKLSNVTPVYKNEDESLKSNYRPIIVLSTIPNVFEQLKFDQLYRHFSPLFLDNMSGFLRGHSCFTTSLNLTEEWRQAQDKGEARGVGVVAIDLSKAFDSICHNLYYLLSYERMAFKALPLGSFSALSLTVSKEWNAMGVLLIGSPAVWCGIPRGQPVMPPFFQCFD